MSKSTLCKMTAIVGAAFMMAASAQARAVTVPAPTATKGTYSAYVQVTWAASSYGRNGYIVYRTPTQYYRNAVRLGTTKNRYWLDRSAQSGRKYWYWVAPKGITLTYGQTAWAKQGGFKRFVVPRPVVSKGKSPSKVYLSWSYSPQARYGYRIYRGTTSSFSSAYSIGTTYSRYFYDSTAYPGRIYYYWVAPRGYNITVYDSSKWGNGWLQLWIPTPKVSQSGSYAYLKWSKITGAQKYRVYRGTTSSFSYAKWIGTATGTSGYDVGVKKGLTYYWWIVPVDVHGRTWYHPTAWARFTIR